MKPSTPHIHHHTGNFCSFTAFLFLSIMRSGIDFTPGKHAELWVFYFKLATAVSMRTSLVCITDYSHCTLPTFPFPKQVSNAQLWPSLFPGNHSRVTPSPVTGRGRQGHLCPCKHWGCISVSLYFSDPMNSIILKSLCQALELPSLAALPLFFKI